MVVLVVEAVKRGALAEHPIELVMTTWTSQKLGCLLLESIQPSLLLAVGSVRSLNRISWVYVM